MRFICFHCQSELDKSLAESAGRRDDCPTCKSDLHVCHNCKFFDSGAYNECREPQAERIVDKAKSNFCDFFEFRISSASTDSVGSESSKQNSDSPKSDYLAQLDALFK